MCAYLMLFIVLVTDYIYQACIPTPTRAYHTLQGLDSFRIEESTVGGLYAHDSTYIVNNDVLIILTMTMSAA